MILSASHYCAFFPIVTSCCCTDQSHFRQRWLGDECKFCYINWFLISCWLCVNWKDIITPLKKRNMALAMMKPLKCSDDAWVWRSSEECFFIQGGLNWIRYDWQIKIFVIFCIIDCVCGSGFKKTCDSNIKITL